MTNEEKIAVGLFGWVEQACDKVGCKCYTNSATSAKLWLKSGEAVVGVGLYSWPALSDWNWIRKVEEALAERGLFEEYDWDLFDVCTENIELYEYTATAEQRVEAAIRTLERTRVVSE